jgi:hypothetical protein
MWTEEGMMCPECEVLAKCIAGRRILTGISSTTLNKIPYPPRCVYLAVFNLVQTLRLGSTISSPSHQPTPPHHSHPTQ